MARSGLYKSEVKKARDLLLAKGANPSIDAVRVALGNTGSKSTIHKYLKELEAEGGVESKRTISEALQNLVARLAAELESEANLCVDQVKQEGAEQERRSAATITALQQELAARDAQLKSLDAVLERVKLAHTDTKENFQQEKIARHTLEQQVTGLKDRLAENEAHLVSIEEKHTHARDALEHYRSSVKEQRDQNERRHDQQIQQMQAETRKLQQSLIIKQEDVTRLNQEGARLVADLSHAQGSLYDQKTYTRQLEQKLEALQAVEFRATTLELQLTDRQLQIQTLQKQFEASVAKTEMLATQVREQELARLTAEARLISQQEIVAELRAYLETREQSVQKRQS